MTMRAAILEGIDALSAPQLLLAKLASVVGAEADVDMLSALLPAGSTSQPLAEELRQLQAHAMGSVQPADGRPVFVFRHAVVRETVYGMMTPSQQRTLHLAVGEWLEARAGDRGAMLAPLLAHHFRCADDRPRAVRYLRQAGEQALQAHANGEAVQFLSGALALQPAAGQVDLATARLHRQLAEAHQKLYNLATSREHLLQGLATLGQPVRGGRTALWFGVVGGVASGTLGQWLPHAARGDAQGEAEFLAAQFHQLRAEVAYFEHDATSLLHGTVACLQKTRATGPTRESALSHGTAAIVLGLLGATGAAQRHLRAAEAAARDCGHLPTFAYVQHLACVCHSAVGDWDAAEAAVEAAARSYREVGELYRWQSTRMILAYQALHRGDFARVGRHLDEADEHSVFPSGPQQVRIWFRTAQLAAQNAAALLGTRTAPSPLLVTEVEQLAALADPSQALLCHGFVADAQRLQGRWAEARESAERGLAVLRAHRPTTYYSLLGIASICGTFLSLAEHEPAAWPALRPRAVAALRALQVFATLVPIARPSVHLLRGRMLLLAGRTAAGERLLRRSIGCAERLGTLGVAAAARRTLAMAEDSWSDRATQTGWV
jgi:tetratricopeptide (TPR) repeat protein